MAEYFKPTPVTPPPNYAPSRAEQAAINAAAKKKKDDAAAKKKADAAAAKQKAADQKAADDAKARAAPKPGTQSTDPNAAGFQAGTGLDYNQAGGLYGLTAAQAASQVTLTSGGLLGGAATPSFLTPGGAGGAEGQTVTVSVLELEQEFWSLPAYERQQIEEQLWAGGFFSDTQKAKGKPNFSSPSVAPEIASALAAAANQSIVTGKEFTSLLTSAAADPTNLPTATKPAIFGHGPNAVIDLRNPSDIAFAAHSIFQSTLGRDPTAEELAKATSDLQSADRSTQYSKWQAQEAEAAQSFADQQAQRDASFAASHPNAVGGTPVAGASPADAGLAGMGTGAGTAAGNATGAGDTVSAVLAAIKQHESGGNYQAVNKAGAYGAYQFIPGTWNSEAKAAGYPQYANGRADQAPPAVQDAVARYMAQGALASAGGDPLKVADIWYIGHVATARELDQVPHPEAGNTITPRQYEQSIAQIMGKQGNPAITAGAVPTPGYTPSAYDQSGNTPAAQAAAAQVGPGQMLSSGFIYPFATMDVAGQGQRTDQGWDMQTAPNTPVLAAASGTIQWMHDPSGFGANYPVLILDHAINGVSAIYYGHVTPTVAAGTRVNAGQAIANTNNGTNSPPGWLEIGVWGPHGPTGQGDLMKQLLTSGATGTTAGGTTTSTAGGTDTFTPGSTTEQTAAPASDAYLFTQGTTGANLVPYGAHQILNGIGFINDMIRRQR